MTLDVAMDLCGVFATLILRLALIGVVFGIVTIVCVATKKFPLAVELTMCAVTILLGLAPIFVAQWGESGGHTTFIKMGAYTDEFGGAHNMEEDVWVPTKCGNLGVDFSAPGLILGGGALAYALLRKKTDQENSTNPRAS